MSSFLTTNQILLTNGSYSCSVLTELELDNEPELTYEPELANESELTNEPEHANELVLVNEPELANESEL